MRGTALGAATLLAVLVGHLLLMASPLHASHVAGRVPAAGVAATAGGRNGAFAAPEVTGVASGGGHAAHTAYAAHAKPGGHAAACAGGCPADWASHTPAPAGGESGSDCSLEPGPAPSPRTASSADCAPVTASHARLLPIQRWAAAEWVPPPRLAASLSRAFLQVFRN